MNFKLVTLLLGSCMLVTAPIQAAQYLPDQVKAVYLFRIANFVHWHNEEHKDRLRFCIFGNDEIKKTFRAITKDKKVREMTIDVAEEVASDCDVVFAAGSNKSFLSRVNSDALTIGDAKNFTKSGGMIELKTVNSKIKPVISLPNANKGDFTIGSRLLRVSTLEGDK